MRPVVACLFNLSLRVDGGKGGELAGVITKEAAQAAILQLQLAGGTRVVPLISYFSPRRPVSIVRSVPARIGEEERVSPGSNPLDTKVILLLLDKGDRAKFFHQGAIRPLAAVSIDPFPFFLVEDYAWWDKL